MIALPPSARRLGPWLGPCFGISVALALGACRSRPRPTAVEGDELEEPGVPSVAAPAPAPAASVAKVPARCAPVTRGAAFTIGEPDPTGEGDGQDLPFSVEIGRAAELDQGFALGALGARDRGVAAFVALVGDDGASGRILDLGLTHGTFEPPVVAARGTDLYLLVPDSDAGGNVLRLGVARAVFAASAVTWGPDLSEGWDDSEAFDLAVGKERGLVAWDRWDRAKERGTLRVVDFDPADVSQVAAERALELAMSAEAPRVVARPGGFWLGFAWLLGPEPRKGAKVGDGLDDGLGAVVDLGRRSVGLLPLDERGVPVGKPVRVAATSEHVVVFDLAVAPDGAALVAWRDDRTSPGVEGGAVTVTRVGLDGSLTPYVLEADDVGSGAPALVADARPGGDRSTVWLALAGLGDTSTLVALGPEGRPRDTLGPEAALGRGEIIARRGERLLVATPRGRSVEVSVLGCRPGSPPPPPPPAGSARPLVAPPAELPE